MTLFNGYVLSSALLESYLFRSYASLIKAQSQFVCYGFFSILSIFIRNALFLIMCVSITLPVGTLIHLVFLLRCSIPFSRSYLHYLE